YPDFSHVLSSSPESSSNVLLQFVHHDSVCRRSQARSNGSPIEVWMSCQTVHVNFPDPRLRKSAVFSSVPMCRDGAQQAETGQVGICTRSRQRKNPSRVQSRTKPLSLRWRTTITPIQR